MSDDWKEYKNLILDMKERNEEDHRDINAALFDIKVEIAKQKVQASFWGGLGGIATAIIGVLTFWKGLK